jgi:glucans biosynthesis protein
VRRLQLLGGVLVAAVFWGPPSALAQTPAAQQAPPGPQASPPQAPPASQSPNQPATEQTQPAATPTGAGQTPPATTSPAQTEPQSQSLPPSQPQPQPQSKPQSGPKPGQSRQEPAKAESKSEPARSEGARSEASRPESKTEQSKPEQGRPEPGKPEQGKPEQGKPEQGKPEQGKPEQEKSEPSKSEQSRGKAAASDAGQAAPAPPKHTRPAAAGPSPQQQPAAEKESPAQQAPGQAGAARAVPARQPPPPFSFATVEKLAQDRASKPYRNRSAKLPDAITKLTYDQYRDIRFQRNSALWHDRALFEVQFFHRGFNFDRRVNIFEVSDAVARPVLYNPAMFDFGSRVPKIEFPPDLGFAGFRIHYPLNTPAYKDELIVFLGASYFRVLGRNQVYGMSARGLAIDTASASGEEFPYFTDFWLVKPDPQARTMTLYALLDSPGITGAYQFEVRPGTTTQVQVSAELYPRRQIAKLGIAPLTSMYLYGENSGNHRFDDYRPEVHDSDGLMWEAGTGEWLWRPLVNPKELRVNRFMEEHPRSFALVQRDRDFSHYQDNEARYDRRPSYRIEPLGDWGKGGVELVEIPSDEEIHDNIVAYWVPDTPVQPQKPMTFSYLLYAYTTSTQWPPGGKVIATHFSRVVSGTTVVPGVRRVIVDFAGGDLDSLAGAQPVQAAASASGGEIDSIAVERLAANGVWRVSMRMKPNGDKPVDLRCYLTLYGEALTETWTYLWSPGA